MVLKLFDNTACGFWIVWRPS